MYQYSEKILNLFFTNKEKSETSEQNRISSGDTNVEIVETTLENAPKIHDKAREEELIIKNKNSELIKSKPLVSEGKETNIIENLNPKINLEKEEGGREHDLEKEKMSGK